MDMEVQDILNVQRVLPLHTVRIPGRGLLLGAHRAVLQAHVQGHRIVFPKRTTLFFTVLGSCQDQAVCFVGSLFGCSVLMFSLGRQNNKQVFCTPIAIVFLSIRRASDRRTSWQLDSVL